MSNKKNFKKKSAFSLIEIIVSLAIFSIIITLVIGISIKLISSQGKLQAKVFLVQTTQTTLELMSRQLRFGYNYAGSTKSSYDASPNGNTMLVNLENTGSTALATTSQILVNAQNSPYVLFEGQSGNPNDFRDQNAFCAYNKKLYKISTFTAGSSNTSLSAICSEGQSILPDEINLDYISFDIYGDSSVSPKNPMVRIKLKLSNENNDKIEMQTTVTQRLVGYF